MNRSPRPGVGRPSRPGIAGRGERRPGADDRVPRWVGPAAPTPVRREVARREVARREVARRANGRSARRPAPPATPSLAYSPGLDGLRAVAVAAVMVYHLGVPWLPGGFLGVDLFFVLSGFLITTLLVTEFTTRGTVDLARFWTRRARRLLPASLLVVVAVMMFGAIALPAYRLDGLRQDGVWTLLYGANWRFVLSGQSYFEEFVPPSPLRHAWSLAIEEQFYLLWPLLVLALLRVGRRRGRTLVPLAVVAALAAVLSAVLMAVLFVAHDPSRSYYGTDTRAHQLLVGALVAVGLCGRWAAPLARGLAALAPFAALAVLAGFLWVTDVWPGYYRGAGFAFGLAAAILVAGVQRAPRSALARLAAAGPLPWIGGISYGLYLWHWPVYRAVDEVGPELPEPVAAAAKVTLTLGLAAASYAWVERPIRRGRPLGVRLTPRRVAVAAPVAVAAALAVTIVATSAPTAETALPEVAPRSTYSAPPRPGMDTRSAYAVPRQLVQPTGAAMPLLAVSGDSVARSLVPGLAREAALRGWGFVDASTNACSATGVLVTDEHNRIWPAGRACPPAVPRMQRNLVIGFDPAVVVVHSRWELSPVRGPDGRLVLPGTAAHRAYMATRWREAMRRLTAGQATVVWVDTMPAADSLCRRLGTSSRTCTSVRAADARAEAYDALRDAVAAEFAGRVRRVSVRDLLCPDGTCPAKVDDRELRPDGLHFVPATSGWIAPRLLRRVDAVTPG
jgi:peptidoglycan/LPS O-acetylase OafA/YrhL